jgi:hypothetical protein
MKPNLTFDCKKATQALNYLASAERDKRINKMKAIKLIWVADRFHLRKYGRLLTNDTYVAMKFGPVGSSVKNLAEDNVRDMSRSMHGYVSAYIRPSDDRLFYSSVNEPDTKVFSQAI